jgi:hypothetical protein
MISGPIGARSASKYFPSLLFSTNISGVLHVNTAPTRLEK